MSVIKKNTLYVHRYPSYDVSCDVRYRRGKNANG